KCWRLSRRQIYRRSHGHLIRDFFARYDPKYVRFRVLNKPYLRALTTYPDLVIFKRQKPWVVIELKEQRQLSRVAAQKEWFKLIKARNSLQPKRVDLI